MKHRLIAAALFISLLFNAGVLVGYFRRNMEDSSIKQSSREDDTARRLTEILKLTPEQADYFRHLREEQRKKTGNLEERIQLVRTELEMELQNPQPQPDRLAALAEEQAKLEHERRLAGSDFFRKFAEKLTPEQRMRLVHEMRPPDRRGRRRGMERMLRRFDTNHDGVLDEKERSAARKMMEQMHRENARRGNNRNDKPTDFNHPFPPDDLHGMPPDRTSQKRIENQVRHTLRERFDINHNGRIDPEEEQALMRWLLHEPSP